MMFKQITCSIYLLAHNLYHLPKYVDFYWEFFLTTYINCLAIYVDQRCLFQMFMIFSFTKLKVSI